MSSVAHDQTVEIYFRDDVIGALVSNRSMRPFIGGSGQDSATWRLGLSGRRYRSRFYPDWLRLPQDDMGKLIFPRTYVTSIVERRFEWRRIMGNIDGATWAVLCDQTNYPRVDWMLKWVYKRNHPSWEQDDVKRVLGPKFAAYLVQGALEGVPHDCRRQEGPG